MDSIIPEDVSYLSFLNDKTHNILFQNNHETTIVQENGSFEPILTEFVNGNATWTIDGVPIFFNESVLPEEEEEEQSSSSAPVESEENNVETIDTVQTTEAVEYPIEIPGKGFITSSGLFFSNEILMQLNLPEILDKPNALELISQQLYKTNDAIFINNIAADKEDDKTKSNVPLELEFNANLIEPENEGNNDEANINDLIEIISVHKCKNCSALFERYEEIVAHIKTSCQVKVPEKMGSPMLLAKKQKMSSLLMTDENKMPIIKDIYLCGMCENVGCENLENLKKHMLSKHNVTYVGDANQIQGVVDKSKLKNHFQNIVSRQQLESRRVKCIIKGCDARFPKPEVMMKHHECHVNGESKKFKCTECGKSFSIWRLCSAHMWKCHKVDIGLFTCTVCNSFKSLSSHNLLVHMTIHETSKPYKPFLCSICGKDFRLLAQLKNHEVVHRQIPDNGKWITKKLCSICNRAFSDSKVLKKHIQAVHNKYKPFICNICGHKCARKAMLELHLRQHTGEKPYKCDICEYKTGDHNSLRRHTSRHLGETKYSCPHCDYQTIQSIAFKLHIKRKHPGREGLFSCLICSFDTVNENMYNEHIKRHSVSLENGTPLKLQSIHINVPNDSITQLDTAVPNIEDEETQTGLFSSDHLDDMTVDTGGITIPADTELQ